jgi:hypothetical protein
MYYPLCSFSSYRENSRLASGGSYQYHDTSRASIIQIGWPNGGADSQTGSGSLVVNRGIDEPYATAGKPVAGKTNPPYHSVTLYVLITLVVIWLSRQSL